jgi:molybdate transport system ATP-binding protein
VLGPNGAGKSTLLSLINADNPRAYGNQIRLFGRPRGSGESIWDIKRAIGWVAPELQQYYPKQNTCADVVCSGVFDTIGLYRACTPEHRAAALAWMQAFHLNEIAEQSFGSVSAGEQRLVLFARALVKTPRLLVLDEPCQGLDAAHRATLVALIDHLCRQTGISLIYVTHHADELPTAITHVLRLVRGRIQTIGTLADFSYMG